MTFEEYRESLMLKPIPSKVDCIAWLQSDWRTLAGTLQVIQWLGKHTDTVLILGHYEGERIFIEKAPTTQEMESMLSHVECKVLVEPRCYDTREQAREFHRVCVRDGFRSAIAITTHSHMPRASLAFAGDVDVTWRHIVGTVDAARDRIEKDKIPNYGLMLPEEG